MNHHKALVVVATVSSVGWMVYLTIMIYEHRKVLREMGGRL